MNATVKSKKNKGGAAGALSSLLGETSLEKAAPQERIVKADTASCRMWKFADRPDDEGEHLEGMMNSIQNSGQLHPAIARLCNDPEFPAIKYEIIVGKVRWLSCSALGIPIELKVKEIDDRAAYEIMIDENEHRSGISDYARSVSLALCLSAGLYDSKKVMAEKLKISPSTLSYNLAFASLPETLVKALGNMREITLAMGYRLSQAVKKLSEEEVLALIPEIKAGNLSAAQLEAMVAKPATPKAQPEEEPEDPTTQSVTGSDSNLPESIIGSNERQVTHGDMSPLPEEPEEESDDDDIEGITTDQHHMDSNTQQVGNQAASTVAGSKASGNSTEETDLERANNMSRRIEDCISCSALLDEEAKSLQLTMSFSEPVCSYLLRNDNIFQSLINELKKEAALHLELEAPLDLFDQVAGD